MKRRVPQLRSIAHTIWEKKFDKSTKDMAAALGIAEMDVRRAVGLDNPAAGRNQQKTFELTIKLLPIARDMQLAVAVELFTLWAGDDDVPKTPEEWLEYLRSKLEQQRRRGGYRPKAELHKILEELIEHVKKKEDQHSAAALPNVVTKNGSTAVEDSAQGGVLPAPVRAGRAVDGRHRKT